MKIGKFSLFVIAMVVVATILVSVNIFIELGGPAPDRDYSVQIRQLAALFSLYHSDTNEWPDMALWKTQIKDHFPTLEKNIPHNPKYGVFIDFWGNEIKYRIDVNENKTERILYSIGRNKKDEKGKGDDIVQIIK